MRTTASGVAAPSACGCSIIGIGIGSIGIVGIIGGAVRVVLVVVARWTSQSQERGQERCTVIIVVGFVVSVVGR